MRFGPAGAADADDLPVARRKFVNREAAMVNPNIATLGQVLRGSLSGTE